jgi:hypothetical protein
MVVSHDAHMANKDSPKRVTGLIFESCGSHLYGLRARRRDNGSPVPAENKARTGESLSFTAFIIGCVGQAVAEHKAVQSYRQGRGHLVVFDDVDVAIVFWHFVTFSYGFGGRM